MTFALCVGGSQVKSASAERMNCEGRYDDGAIVQSYEECDTQVDSITIIPTKEDSIHNSLNIPPFGRIAQETKDSLTLRKRQSIHLLCTEHKGFTYLVRNTKYTLTNTVHNQYPYQHRT